jgi:oligoribonuclease NrnB/cAMP/cGMP phosphodiesterase (DHH superfamily)
VTTTPLVIYHADCVDGFTAAWGAWRALGNAATYLPTHHGTPPPDVTGREVYLLDFAYPRSTCLDLARQARSLLILDHHKTALEELGDLPFAHLDMHQSGAGLAWRHFHPQEPPPRLVLAVEDGDLWRHAMPETRAIYLRLSFEPRTFENWSEIARQTASDGGFRAFADEGRVLLEEREFQVERLLLERYEVVLEGETGLAAQGEAFYRSELGHRLAELSGTYGLVWYPRDGGYHVSLRSIGDYDVERLARRFGGGGHRNAAGFTLEDRSLLRLVTGEGVAQPSDR